MLQVKEESFSVDDIYSLLKIYLCFLAIQDCFIENYEFK